MYNKRSAIVICLIIFISSSLSAQEIGFILNKDSTVCYASYEDKSTFIKPPAFAGNFLGAKVETAEIIVNYSGFSTEAKAAFQYAVDIWETLIVSSVPINIDANWQGLESNVLGSAVWGTLMGNFDGARPDTWYPIALAEKINGSELNSGADIIAKFNKDADWYLGTDGKTPSGKFDLVTVVMHEIAHGLGFTHSFSASGNTASWGPQDSENPMIFDTMVQDEKGNYLIEKHNNNSEGLLVDISNDITFFGSDIAATVNDGQVPKLYAPNPFAPGSSIGHLDETTFPAGDINSLMTPSIGQAEAIHDPGPVTLAIFTEVGWVWTFIDHEPIKNIEDVSVDILFEAAITSDTLFDKDNVYLHYSYDRFETESLTKMVNEDGDFFRYSLPSTGAPEVISYYITVSDYFGRTITKPEDPTIEKYIFQIGPDSDPPEIKHTPVSYVFDTDEELIINANVTDAIGVSEVILNYKIGFKSETVAMSEVKEAGNVYTYKIDLTKYTMTADRFIEYTITAVDNSLNENTAISPEEGKHTVIITSIQEPVNSYVNDFNQLTSDFVGFKMAIDQPNGFSSAAIHSEHPYQNGSDINFESEYIYLLRKPVIIDDTNHYMQFDEIVLVEPGDSEGYWDYVAVEGSTDKGKTWKEIIRYDSRVNPFWMEAYNETISGDNSLTQGSPSLLKRRIINIIGNGRIKRGEEVVIRFKLFADQLANGWGWMIDNLIIQDEITSLQNSSYNRLQIYPNPVRTGILKLNTAGLSGNFKLAIFEQSGKLVYDSQFNDAGNDETHEINLHSLSNGLYFLRLEHHERQWTEKLMIE